jgi:hypothetical protein
VNNSIVENKNSENYFISGDVSCTVKKEKCSFIKTSQAVYILVHYK